MVERIERSVSDHCHQLLRFETTIARKSLFKFYNVIADHEIFLQILRINWDANKDPCLLRDIWRKCRKLQSPLKELNTKWFMRTAQRVDYIRQKLHTIQTSLGHEIDNCELEQEEKWLLGDLEKWSSIEEKIWFQKARID